ncbi:MAG: hypothetical protein IPK82_19900 [Polyangiaceae bacterium]|nr:hypothetical protein [Polyangiaceae bacterium]
MTRTWTFAAVAAVATMGCAAGSDGAPGSVAAQPESTANGTAGGQVLTAPASIEARDVAVLVIEQTSAVIRVLSSATRPRSSFGPAASWNGTGTPTHRWTLRDRNGAEVTSGGIVAKTALEAPPNSKEGVGAANVPLSAVTFEARVPVPAAGEWIEIAAVNGSVTAARWP